MGYSKLFTKDYDDFEADMMSNSQNLVAENGYPRLLTFTGTTWENYAENYDAEKNRVQKEEGLLGFTTSFDSAMYYSVQAYRGGGVDLNGVPGGQPVIMIQRIPLAEINFGASQREPDFNSGKTVEQTSATEFAAEEYPADWIDALALSEDGYSDSENNTGEYLQKEDNWRLITSDLE